MLDKAKLGTRYACFQCGTKFYDMNRPVPSCPECSADQREAPVRDLRSLLGGKGPLRKRADEEEAEEPAIDDDEDDAGLLDGVDDEDDDDDAPELDDEEEESGGGGGGGGEDDW